MTDFRTRWLIGRNRWLGDPGFQRWSLKLPLLKRKARAEAAALFDLMNGFVATKTVTAFVDSGLLARLAAAPATMAELAAVAGLSEAACARLLAAAAAYDLAEAIDDQRSMTRWTLGQRGAALSRNAGALALIEHHKLFYRDLEDPLARLRAGPGGGELAAFWGYAGRAARGEPVDPADPMTAAYSALMAASQPMVAEQVLAAWTFGRHRRLMDVGGGHGAFLSAVAARHPRLDLMLFDLPPVAARASEVLAAQGLSRIVVHGGSFRDEPLPTGADAISLVRIAHDHDDDVVAALLARCHAALPKGGTLLLAEPLAGTRGARAMGDGYFGFYLWAMGSGRPRTADTYRRMLLAAGFAAVREVPTALPLVTRLLVATA